MSTGQAISTGMRPPYLCPECDSELIELGGESIYPYNPRMHARQFWCCRKCKAWVPSHPDHHYPVGTPANAVLRALRHDVIEKATVLIKRKMNKEGADGKSAYKSCMNWIGKEVGLGRECYIHLLTLEEARAAIKILNIYVK